jgi:aryl-alcohol dehydrogenase-like predicted oxidoreductase
MSNEQATKEGTGSYRNRMVAGGIAHAQHFREGLGGLSLSSIGLGTHLGGYDARTDALYVNAVKQAIRSGCNVVDTAINYRCQRSERAIGRALRDLIDEGTAAREEILISTKGGYIPYNETPPPDGYAYLQETFVRPGVMMTSDVVAESHCMTPSYLRHQLDASLANLGLSCVDVYYLHNPETQLEEVRSDEFIRRIQAAFEVLEEAVKAGKIRVYGTATWNAYRARVGSGGHVSLEAMVKAAEDVAGARHHFKVIQVPYNLGMPEALTEQTQTINGSKVSVLEAAKALGVYVTGSAAMLQGQLSRDLPEDLGSRLGQATDAQRAIQFVRSTPGMGTALVGMKQTEHVRDNLAVSAWPPLTPDRFAELFA